MHHRKAMFITMPIPSMKVLGGFQ